MRALSIALAAAGLFAFGAGSTECWAAGAIDGGGRQALNVPAIVMFLVFVGLTLGITKWAANRTRRRPTSMPPAVASPASRTAWRSPATTCRRLRSWASRRLVFATGFDGLIYSVGFLVGWPVILFLIAERLRNLGKFTFADVVAYRLQQTPIRVLAAIGTLAVVAFYLIAQMVGAGKLIELLFGLPYLYAVIIVGVLMIVYVTLRRHARDDLGADHQGLPAAGAAPPSWR